MENPKKLESLIGAAVDYKSIRMEAVMPHTPKKLFVKNGEGYQNEHTRNTPKSRKNVNKTKYYIL